MPRQARIAVPEVIYHVTARGNNRNWIFHDDEDFAKFQSVCEKYQSRLGFKVYHWVLMNSHVHLLMQPVEWHTMAKGMQGIKLSYTQWYNRKYKQVGHLWQGRFKSCPVEETAYLLACGRYIERNPVRAGLVTSPADYRWSSVQAHGHGVADNLTDCHPLLESLGSEPNASRQAWRDYISEASEKEEAELREHFARGLAGSDGFGHAIVEASLGRIRPKRGRPGK